MSGILVVETDCCEHGAIYQIIGEVASMEEAAELAKDYEQNASPDNGDIPPDRFVVIGRGKEGRYSERITLQA